MNITNAARGSGAVGLIAGALWCALSGASLVTPDPEWYLDALFLAPFSLTLLAFAGLHRLQRDHLGRLGLTAYWLSAGAMVAVLIGQAGLVLDTEALVWLGFPVGAIGWLVGFGLYGIATVRAGVLPRWFGWAVALSEPLTVLLGVAFSPISPLAEHGDFSGALGHGIVWLAIGWTLRSANAALAARVAAQPAT